MTQASFKEFLELTSLDEASTIFAMNCFEYGKQAMREQLADELQKMPLNDTANSIAIWIRGQE